jgi:hypothetical protein
MIYVPNILWLKWTVNQKARDDKDVGFSNYKNFKNQAYLLKKYLLKKTIFQ